MPVRTEEFLNMEIEVGLPVASERIKVLAICSGPIKNGNVQWAAEAACNILESFGNIDCEVVHLEDYDLKNCVGCDFCMKATVKSHFKVGMDVRPAPIEGYNCSIKDDMPALWEKLLAADGIIVSVPVYIGTMPANLKNFFDRGRSFVHDHRLWGKIGMPISVAFFRNAGSDINSLILGMSLRALGVISLSSAQLLSSIDGTGVAVKTTRFAVSEDPIGMSSLISQTNHFALLLQTQKAGQAALGLDYNKPWKMRPCTYPNAPKAGTAPKPEK